MSRRDTPLSLFLFAMTVRLSAVKRAKDTAKSAIE
jgi:hypothetical protein